MYSPDDFCEFSMGALAIAHPVKKAVDGINKHSGKWSNQWQRVSQQFFEIILIDVLSRYLRKFSNLEKSHETHQNTGHNHLDNHAIGDRLFL